MEQSQLLLSIAAIAVTVAGLCWAVFQSQLTSLRELLSTMFGELEKRIRLADEHRDQARTEISSAINRASAEANRLADRIDTMVQRLGDIETDLTERCEECPAPDRIARRHMARSKLTTHR